MQQLHAGVREFRHVEPIMLTKEQGVPRLVAWKGNTMHRNKSKFAAIALVAAIGLGTPALAKSTHGGKAHGGKAKVVASLSTCNAKAPHARALNVDGSAQRVPTFGAPNPNSPALIGGGSAGYNANLYVY
jgi:hypothetical protein